MRGLEKNRMGRGHVHTRTSRLLDRIGPVGRFDENLIDFATGNLFMLLNFLMSLRCECKKIVNICSEQNRINQVSRLYGYGFMCWVIHS